MIPYINKQKYHRSVYPWQKRNGG